MGTFWRPAGESLQGSESLWSVLGVQSRRESIASWARFLDLFDHADRDRLRELCRGGASPDGTEAEAEFRIVGEDEKPRVVRIHTRRICSGDGRYDGVLGIVTAVSERSDVEREIAHELRNQLMVVLGNLDLVQMSTTGGTKAARYIALALESAERCAELTERMLVSSRARTSR